MSVLIKEEPSQLVVSRPQTDDLSLSQYFASTNLDDERTKEVPYVPGVRTKLLNIKRSKIIVSLQRQFADTLYTFPAQIWCFA